MRTWLSSRPRFYVYCHVEELIIVDRWFDTSVSIFEGMTVKKVKTLVQYLHTHGEHEVEVDANGIGPLVAQLLSHLPDLKVVRCPKPLWWSSPTTTPY